LTVRLKLLSDLHWQV